MCGKVVSKEPFMLYRVISMEINQELCDKAVDSYLPALKYVPDWVFTGKINLIIHYFLMI